jgi:putative hydrolase of the HAD superfamily
MSFDLPLPSPEHLRAVTFDVTGTLIHSPRIGEIYQEVFGRHGLRADAKEIRRLIPLVFRELACRTDGSHDRFTSHPEGPRGWWRRFATRLAEYLELPEPSRFATAELYDRFGHADAWEVYPDVLPTLDALEKAAGRLGVTLRFAVVANWDERLPELLAELGLADRFSVVVHASGVGYEKPDPRIFAVALDRLDLQPEEAVHVGDREKEDIEGAVGAGLGAVRIVRHLQGWRPPATIVGLDELPAALGFGSLEHSDSRR